MINVAVIGPGGLGRRRAEILQSLPGVQVSALVGRSARGETVANELGVRFETSVASGVRDADAVVIAAHTDQHLDLVEQALSVRKPLFLEKPLASNLPDSIRVHQLIADAGVPAQVGYQRRYLPDYVRAYEAVQRGDVGRVFTCMSISRDRECPDEAYIQSSGGIWHDFSVHDINLIRWFIGSEVDWVEGVGTNGDTAYLEKHGDYEETLGVMHFESGALGYVAASRSAHYGADIRTEIWGETSSVFVDLNVRSNFSYLAVDGVVQKGFTDYLDVFGRAFVAETKAWVDGLTNGTPSPMTTEEALKDSIIAEAFTVSSRERRRVYLEEVLNLAVR